MRFGCVVEAFFTHTIPMREAKGQVLVPSHQYARLQWLLANRAKALDEARLKQAHEERRQAEQRQLQDKVNLARSASAGRVAFSQNRVLAEKQEHRREEARREMLALAEKARRRQEARDDHDKLRAARFKPITADEAEKLHRYDSARTLLNTPHNSRSVGSLRPATSSVFSEPRVWSKVDYGKKRQVVVDLGKKETHERPWSASTVIGGGSGSVATTPSTPTTPSTKGVGFSYVSMTKANLPEGCKPLDTLPVANGTHARLAWQEANREKADLERRCGSPEAGA